MPRGERVGVGGTEWGNWRGQVMCKTKLFIADNLATWWAAGHSAQVSQRWSSPLHLIRSAFQRGPPSCTQWCPFSSSRSCPHFSCAMLRRGEPVSSTRWTARTDATRSGAAGRSGAHAPSWMTAAVARSVRPAEGSTATARCPACTGWSAGRDYSASSTRMRTTTETNMASAKVRSRS